MIRPGLVTDGAARPPRGAVAPPPVGGVTGPNGHGGDGDEQLLPAAGAVPSSPGGAPAAAAGAGREHGTETNSGASREPDADTGDGGGGGGGGASVADESFDTEFALLQLEWPQPIGAVRSEGELAPPPPT